MKIRISVFAVIVATFLFGSAFAMSMDEAVGYFDCTKNGETIYLKTWKTDHNDLAAKFVKGGKELFIGAGDFDGKSIKAYDGDDYYVTLTFQGEDAVNVLAGKRVKANIGTALDGTYKRHYGK